MNGILPELHRLLHAGRYTALTPRQREVYRYIVGYRDEKRSSPTLQEIGKAMGISKITAWEHCLELVKRGVIRRDIRARSIELV